MEESKGKAMTFTKETPTKPGYYLWRTKLTSGPVISEILTIGESPVLWLETDGTREPLNELVESQHHNNLEWCLLVPSDEIEKAWREAEEHPLDLTGISGWNKSRAKRVIEGEQ